MGPVQIVIPKLRKARGLTRVELAKALKVSADELLGIESVKARGLAESPEKRRLWRKFQQVMELPERDQRAVIRLVNSLAANSPDR